MNNVLKDLIDTVNKIGINGIKPYPDHVPSEAIPVAAMERLGKGVVVLLGADPFTNFHYPTEWDGTNQKPIKWDHGTPEFNLALLKILQNL